MWIVKLAGWYLDEFGNWWNVQKRAERYVTRAQAAWVAEDVGGRVVALVPKTADYVLWCEAIQQYVRALAEETPGDWFGTEMLTSAQVFDKEGAEIVRKAWARIDEGPWPLTLRQIDAKV